jgi:hypothetical protein
MRFVISATVVAAAACGGDSGVDTIRTDLPPGPADGTGQRLVTPTFTVGGGKEVFMCMRLPADTSQDLYVNSSEAYQVTGGHHSMLYYTDQPTGGDEPHECNDADMGNIRFIGVGTADGVGITLPEGVVLKIPKGAKVYTQSHYLNSSDDDIVAQDVVDLHTLPISKVQMVAGAFTEVDLGLELQPGVDTTRVIDCTMPRAAMTVPWMIPHMHELGQNFKLELIHEGQEPQTLYESTWDETLRDHFPLINFDPFLQMTSTDRLRTTCTWHNTDATPRLFPHEMCATFMPFFPSSDGALLACDEHGNQFNP